MAWGREESIGQSGRADLGLEEDGDASHGKAPHAAAGRSSRMPQSRNQSSPVPPPPSTGPGGRDIAAEETFWGLITKFVDLLVPRVADPRLGRRAVLWVTGGPWRVSG